MHGGESQGVEMPLSQWERGVQTRTKPKNKRAVQYELGTIAQCLPGDVVACESIDGKRVIYLSIAWQWRNDEAAMVRLWDFRGGGISLKSEFMRTVQGFQKVRWITVRPR